MKIIATTDEKLDMVYEALTTGMSYFNSYGFELDWEDGDYTKARQELANSERFKTETICIEDVYRQMLFTGCALTFTDIEGEGDNTKALTLGLIEQHWDKIPFKIINEFASGDYDANSADLLMQYILFGEIVYG